MSKYTDMLQGNSSESEEKPSKYVDMIGSGNTIAGRGGIPREQAYAETRASVQARTPKPDPFVRDPDKGAPLKTIAGASFADDPGVKIEYFAKKRFPNLPMDEAVSRYGLSDGEITYRGDDGQTYTETPTMGDRVAMHLGKALPVGAGTVAGVATAPLWLVPGGGAAATALTGAAAYAGEEVRQALGEKVTGDPVSETEPLKEGAYAAGGELVGGLATKVAGRRVAKDFSRLNAEDAAVLQRLSEKYGIDLTPAEITNLPSLKARQKAVGNLPESADTMGDFYVKRAGQVDEAIEEGLERISPVDSSEVAGGMVRSAAADAMDAETKRRAAKAAPIYKKAFESPTNVDVLPIMDEIQGELVDAKGKIKTSLEKAYKLFINDVADNGLEIPETSLKSLHNVKLALDDMIGTARQEGIGNVARAKLVNIKTKLVRALDSANPEYKRARGIYADLSPGVSKIREGVVGVIANMKDEQLQKAASRLFAPGAIGPKSINSAKIAIKKADPEAWQAIKRAWLNDQWEQASKSSATTGNLNRGAKFRALLMGDKKRARNLRAALDPEEYTYLEELSKVLDASGRVKQVGSDTAWNEVMNKEMADEASSVWANLVDNINPAQALRNLKDWSTKRNVRTLAKDMADVITSPDAMTNLKELQKLTPGSAKAAVLTAHALGLAGTEAVGSALE